ncbi:MAG: IclR family transcriptional regulator [Micromonosporaceae bacterium]
MAPQTGTQAIDRAASLLTLVVQSEEPRSFTSLVDELDLAKSTTSRLLQALERNRLVRRDRDGSFRPGPLFTLYAARHSPVDDLVQVAEPTLQRLGDALGETINLSVPRGDSVVQVAQVDSTYRLSATNWLDVETPPHCSALGKIFYAYRTLPLPSGRLERLTPDTITTRAALERDLEQVVRRGYAVTRGELEPGLASVAAPVRNRDGGVIAAVSVSGPTARIDEQLDQISGQVLVETRTLSHLLGYQANKARKEGAA